MKRCLLAAALVTACTFGVASADYIIIKIDLNQPLPGEQKAGAGNYGAYPGAPGSGYPGKGGGAGAPGGSFPGAGSDMGGPGMGTGKGGRGGFPGGGGAGSGYPGGAGAGSGYPGGAGAGSGYPGADGGSDQPPPSDGVPDKAPLYVYACLELKVPGLMSPGNKFGKIDHRLGKKVIVPWATVVSYVTLQPISARFASKFNNLKENKTLHLDTRKNKLIDLAGLALQCGLLKQFNEVIDELKQHDAKNAVVAAVEKTRKELATAPKSEDAAALALMDELKKEGYRTLTSPAGHYTFMTNVPASAPHDEELLKKMSRMEDVYTTFFLWFALKGDPRTPPAHRLTAVVVDTPYNNPKDFDVKQAVFNFVPMVGSGFTAQRDNVVIAASRRTDEAFNTLQYTNHMKWETARVSSKELLLDPKFLERRLDLGNEIPTMQTLALVQKAMEDEGEMTTLSHEGIRQLVAAVGMLPRTVATAEWARFGLASFFEVPHYAFFPSIGGPSWEYLASFQALKETKKVQQKDAKEILVKVITDDYFHQAYDALRKSQLARDKDKDERQLLQLKADAKLEIARTTAWSLMYFLVRNKSDQVRRYCREIAELPRDMNYDSKVLKECFYRAFGLLVPDRDAPGRQLVDVNKLETLAAEWFSSLEDTHQQDLPKLEQDLKTKVMDELLLRDKMITKLQDPTPRVQAGAGGGPGGFPGMGQGGFPGMGPAGGGSSYPPGMGAPGNRGNGGGGAGSGYPPGAGPGQGNSGNGGGGAGSGYPGGAGPGAGNSGNGGGGAGSGYPGGAGKGGKGIN
jgi:hypothetical protein